MTIDGVESHLVDLRSFRGYIFTVKTVLFTSTAQRELRKLPADVRAQVEAKLTRYAETGFGDVQSLKGLPGLRLRSGDYHIVFTETEASVEVRAVTHRREVYR